MWEDVTLSPITKMVQHACAVTQNYKFRVQQHFIKIANLYANVNENPRDTEVILNQ